MAGSICVRDGGGSRCSGNRTMEIIEIAGLIGTFVSIYQLFAQGSNLINQIRISYHAPNAEFCSLICSLPQKDYQALPDEIKKIRALFATS